MDMYDTYMVFVNTSLQIAEKEMKKEIELYDSIVRKSWEDVQSNLGFSRFIRWF